MLCVHCSAETDRVKFNILYDNLSYMKKKLVYSQLQSEYIKISYKTPKCPLQNLLTVTRFNSE